MNLSAPCPGAGSWRSAADSETTPRRWRGSFGRADRWSPAPARVPPGAPAAPVAGTQAMVTAPRERHGDVADLSFDVADAARLPLDDAGFDACRVDRVLQHIPHPPPGGA